MTATPKTKSAGKQTPKAAVSKAAPTKAKAKLPLKPAAPAKLQKPAVAAAPRRESAEKSKPTKAAPGKAAVDGGKIATVPVAPAKAPKAQPPAKATPSAAVVESDPASSAPIEVKSKAKAKAESKVSAAKDATKETGSAIAPAPQETLAKDVALKDAPVVKETPVKEAKVPTGKNAPIPGAMVAPASPAARAAALAFAENAPPRQPAQLRPVGRSMPAPVPVRTAVKLLKAAAINPDDEFEGIEELSDGQFFFQQRQLLISQRNSLQGQAEAFQSEADQIAAEMEPGDVQFDDESGEGGTMSMERERDLAMSAQFLLKVEEVEEALARFETGEYGFCSHCQKPVSRPRLRALPFTTLCIECKNGGLSRR